MTKESITLTEHECFLLLNTLLTGFGSCRRRHKATRNHVIALLMLDAGLRINELCQLRVEDLFYENSIKHSLYIRPEIAKLSTPRYIPLSSRLQTALEILRENCWRKFYFEPDDFAFARHRKGKSITPRQVERIIKAAAWISIGRDIYPHMLRHTFATRLMKTTNIRIVQQLLGHKHLSSTQVYTHPDADDLVKAIGSLNSG